MHTTIAPPPPVKCPTVYVDRMAANHLFVQRAILGDSWCVLRDEVSGMDNDPSDCLKKKRRKFRVSVLHPVGLVTMLNDILG